MDLQGVRIGGKSLSLFLKAATKLQQCDGKADDDDLWSFAVDPSYNAQDAISDKSLGSIRRLEAVEDVLRDLLESCERKLKTMKSGCQRTVSGPGIEDLPDEVLSSIFEFAKEEIDISVFPRHRSVNRAIERVLTDVCPRFQSLALRLPVLWTYIDSHMSNSDVVARLESSRNCLLTIVIAAQFWSEELQHFFGLVIPHAHRWISFSADISRGHIEMSMGNLQLLQLEYFYTRSDHLDDYRNWDMPKLRHVSIEGGIHRTPPGAFSGQTVRSLVIDYAVCNQTMMDYLVSVPNLTELRIATDGKQASYPSAIRGTLPRLKKMSLSTEDERIFDVLFCSCRTPMPELSILNLTVQGCKAWYMEEMPVYESYPSLHELNLWYAVIFNDRDEGDDIAMDLSVLFDLFPEMRRLNLKTFCRNFKCPDDATVPPLLSCSAWVYDDDDLRSLYGLVSGLKQSERWELFEFFQLKVAKPISRRDADKICTREKVRWCE